MQMEISYNVPATESAASAISAIAAGQRKAYTNSVNDYLLTSAAGITPRNSMTRFMA